MTKIKGIDISYWQGNVNFKKVAEDGIKFAVLRQGYRKSIDSKFLDYVKGCKNNNINIMIYHFIYTDGAAPKENAESTYNNIKKANLNPADLWIAADLEYDTWIKNNEVCTKEKCTKYTKEYLDTLQKLGCKKLFIYTNNDYYVNYYDWSKIKYPIWLADYQGEPNYKCVMHQYTSLGKVNGINGKVDIDWLFDETMLLSQQNTATPSNTQKQLNKETKEIGIITANWLNIRTWAGTNFQTVSFSPLPKDTKLNICDTIKAEDGSSWYYINYNGKYGFASAKYIKTSELPKETNETYNETKYSKYINNKTTHYISNCSGDQNKKISGGAAGDQTSKEWCLKAWYNRPWNYVLRYPDEKIRLKIAELGIEAALNDNIGYDQDQRQTYWVQLKNSNYNPKKITKKCEADCSAGVIANTKAVGYLFNLDNLKHLSASYTGNMRSGFKKAGFTILTDRKYLTSPDYLLPGDILLYENHHTATNITKGKKV